MHDDHHYARVVSGLAFAAAGYSLFALSDSVVKWIGHDWPSTAISLLRYVIALPLLVILIWWREGRSGFRFPDPLLHWARGSIVAFSSVSFFIAITLMPLGEATVIQFASPAIVILISALFLKEHVPRMAWFGTALAFLGVIVVLRPNIALIGWAGIFPLFTALCMAILVLLNRKVANSVHKCSILQIQLLLTVTAIPVLLILTIIGDHSGIARFAVTWPSLATIFKCAIIAVVATLCHGMIFMATQRVSPATMAPVTFTQLLGAVAMGALVFGDRIDTMTILGAGLIILAGLLLWRSQKQLARQSRLIK